MEETDCTKGKKIKYTYDVNGNIVTKMSYTIGNGTLSSDGFVGNQYNDTVWRDRATVINGQSVTYDASGNITAMGSKQYTWTNFRCLESYTNGYAPVTYTYNADGIRTSKTATVSGVPVKTEYTLVGDKITSQTNSGTTLYFCYDVNGDVFGFIYNNQSYYYLKNLLGDVIKVLDSNGNEVVSYSYDTWGVCTASNNSIIGAINPFRYRSYYFDTDSGLYFLQSRYYDPSIGRFINSDDISYLGATGTVLSYNIFAYCENDAVNKVDNDGNFPINIVVGALVGSVFGALAYLLDSAVGQLISTGRLNFKNLINGKKLLSSMLIGAVGGGISASSAKMITQKIVAALLAFTSTVVSGGTVLEAVIITLITIVLTNAGGIGRQFRKFNTGKIQGTINRTQRLSSANIRKIAKLISNNILYYLKSNTNI